MYLKKHNEMTDEEIKDHYKENVDFFVCSDCKKVIRDPLIKKYKNKYFHTTCDEEATTK